MSDPQQTIAALGEKRLLKEIILPMVNPSADPGLSGDDCGVVELPAGESVCASTDRVPWDLTGFRIGLMSERDLGYYLAVLNISDIAAMGATPIGLLLNFALPGGFRVDWLTEILSGVLAASEEYGTPVLGGDLSDAAEPSLVATALGRARPGEMLLRSGAEPGDAIFTIGPCGLTATAMRYFLSSSPPQEISLHAEHDLLRRQFTNPTPQVTAGRRLAQAGIRATAMDNTDGLSQTLSELADADGVHFALQSELLPVHPVSADLAEYLQEDVFDLITGPGADFHLVGTVGDESVLEELGLTRIGYVEPGRGVSLSVKGTRREVQPRGWNYFTGGGKP